MYIALGEESQCLCGYTQMQLGNLVAKQANVPVAF